MSTPYFPAGSLMITCAGGPCFKDGAVLHEGVIPSFSYISFFLSEQRFCLVLPKGHDALLMIRETKSVCVNILPPHLVHDSLFSGNNTKIESLEETGLQPTSCHLISSRRFTQAVAAIECIVEDMIPMQDAVLIQTRIALTHYQDKNLATMKSTVDSHSTQEVLS